VRAWPFPRWCMSFAPAGRDDPDPRPTLRAFDAARGASAIHPRVSRIASVHCCGADSPSTIRRAGSIGMSHKSTSMQAQMTSTNGSRPFESRCCHVLERIGCTPIMGPSNAARLRAANALISTQSPAAVARSVHDDGGHTVTWLCESDRMSPADSGASPASFEPAATAPEIFGDARRAHNGRRMRAHLVRGELLGLDSNQQPFD
jgi:hypothetical protein